MKIVYIRRLHDKRLNLTFDLLWYTAPTSGVMVWGAIACNSRSALIFINGTMTAKSHASNILQPHLATHWKTLRSHFSTGQRSATHSKRVFQDCLCHITCLLWPARSPDLFLIEHIWDHLGQQVGQSMSLAKL